MPTRRAPRPRPDVVLEATEHGDRFQVHALDRRGDVVGYLQARVIDRSAHYTLGVRARGPCARDIATMEQRVGARPGALPLAVVRDARVEASARDAGLGAALYLA